MKYPHGLPRCDSFFFARTQQPEGAGRARAPTPPPRRLKGKLQQLISSSTACIPDSVSISRIGVSACYSASWLPLLRRILQERVLQDLRHARAHPRVALEDLVQQFPREPAGRAEGEGGATRWAVVRRVDGDWADRAFGERRGFAARRIVALGRGTRKEGGAGSCARVCALCPCVVLVVLAPHALQLVLFDVVVPPVQSPNPTDSVENQCDEETREQNKQFRQGKTSAPEHFSSVSVRDVVPPVLFPQRLPPGVAQAVKHNACAEAAAEAGDNGSGHTGQATREAANFAAAKRTRRNRSG